MYKERMEEKLIAALHPISLEVIDESQNHIGHGGAHPEGETHFFIKMVVPDFENLSQVERHKRVYKILEEEMKERVHALRLETRSS